MMEAMQAAASFAGAIMGTGPSPESKALMDWVEKQHSLRRTDYIKFRKYYDGKQTVPLTDRLKSFLGNNGDQFVDNFMEVVVDALAERLTVIGFSGENEALNEYAWGVWQANRMDDNQVSAHIAAAKLGDTYVLVDWDDVEKRPMLSVQQAEMIIPHYNETTGKIDMASKKWMIESIGDGKATETRMNLYFADRIEKFTNAGGGTWKQFMDEGETDWPTPWVDKGSPLGVPMFHFRNRRDDTDFGTSEMDGVIPMQDFLDKSMVDLVMVLDTMAFGQRWALNIDMKTSKIDITPGSITTFHSKEDVDAQVGEWAASDPNGLLDAIEMAVVHIAGVSRTPQYLFQISGGAPSGESLKMAESGLVAKARRRQINFGNNWEDVIHMAAKLEATFGSVTLEATARVETVWKDPESRNEEAFLTGQEAKARIGVTRSQLLREMGYDESQIDQMDEDREKERAADTNIGGLILENFSQGNV